MLNYLSAIFRFVYKGQGTLSACHLLESCLSLFSSHQLARAASNTKGNVGSCHVLIRVAMEDVGDFEQLINLAVMSAYGERLRYLHTKMCCAGE